MKDWIDLFNSKLALVAFFGINIAFTVFWVGNYAPWNMDKQAIDLQMSMHDENFTSLIHITKDLTKVVNALNIENGKQDVKLEELARRLTIREGS